MSSRPEQLIAHHNMIPHPQGGYCCELYRSQDTVSQEDMSFRYSGDRSVSSSFYYLLVNEQVAKLHRLKSPGIWHFYEGSPLIIHEFVPNGDYKMHTLGPDVAKDETFQAVLPRCSWVGACLKDPKSHTLVGCTISPGYELDDFQLANRQDVLEKFPRYQKIIELLT
ncbi:uncharacterized protein LOC121369008 [Gigantopelta aegis]|uniref:uncharacterized protein LOC121369008 n=1 Tax=Gigantopelta aegis TaxID=1735272 RepID=UPI001B88CA1C|nr:uncharacterized protein LOC121369008 [Gigantopelta aegis]